MDESISLSIWLQSSADKDEDIEVLLTVACLKNQCRLLITSLIWKKNKCRLKKQVSSADDVIYLKKQVSSADNVAYLKETSVICW